MFIRNIFFITIAVLFFTNAVFDTKAKKKKLVFSFHVNNKKGVQPSYQMAIWLEKPDGTYFKTLYVSDYLSYGGFNHKEICPDWIEKSNWQKAPADEVDAVTGATFMFGDEQMTFQFSKNQIPPGKYQYFIEVHLVEKYNELYSGEIEVGGKELKSVPVVKYIPEKHPKAGDILSNVSVICKNK